MEIDLRYCSVEGCENLARQKVPGTRGRSPSKCEEHSVAAGTRTPQEPVRIIPTRTATPPRSLKEITDRWLPHRDEAEPAPDAALSPSPTIEDSPEARPKGPDRSPAAWARQKVRDSPPKVTGRRVPTDDIWQGVWAAAGMSLQHSPWYPVGRILTYQSAAAGPIIDAAIRGTVLDRIVQPVARMGERGKAAGALIGPPLIVGLIGTHPEMAPALAPMLRAMLATMLEELAPIVAAKAKQEAKTAAILAEHFPEWGADPVQGLIDLIFAPPGAAADNLVPEPV